MARVMFADDSEAVRVVLRDVLNIGNHEVAGEAIDGEDTIEKYAQVKPDVLLLDLAMPKKDGLTVIKELMPKFPEAKIIVVTASGDTNLKAKCLDAGALDWIDKPFDASTLLKTISNTISNTITN